MKLNVNEIIRQRTNAGGSPEDQQARRDQVAQLRKVILAHSKGKAVIVAGDLNMDIANQVDDLFLYQALLDSADLDDACSVNECGQDLLDRVLYRGTDKTSLNAVSWRTAAEFRDAEGKPLSDHLAVAVEFKIDNAD